MPKQSAKPSESEEPQIEETMVETADPEGSDETPETEQAETGQAEKESAESEGDAAEESEESPVDGEVAASDEEVAKEAEAAAEAEARSARVGPGDSLSDDEIERSVAALLFASPEPISIGRLKQLLEHPRKGRVEDALDALGRRFEAAGLPFVVRPLAGGWRLLTAPEVSDVVTRLGKSRKTEKLSPAALETLAIIAYRQPATKAEIEAIRGVQAGAVLRALVDRGMIKVAGRSDQPGGALEYGTTSEFLDRFGLGSIKDLPRDGELLEG